ncbi:MAG: type IV secretion system DNA-binding domain-containing protein [Candidatus Dormibacteraeota bacterium]|nr:type IV secretion system DNA-binding domain-containing protein [Candidatus Dormibacteraeota bacterium]
MRTAEIGRRIALRPQDARYHTHAVGPTGSGKSTLLENMALANILAGRAVVFLDIKGDSIYRLLRRIPREHWDQVVLLDPALSERVVGLNVLELADASRRDLVADQVVAIFRRLFAQYWKDRSDDVMRSAVLTLLHHQGTTLVDVPGLLLDMRLQARWTRGLHDPVGLEPFWKEFRLLSETEQLNRVGPVLARLRSILLRPAARNILGQSKSTIDLEKILNTGGILLVNLAKGVLGEETARLLGSLLVVQLWQASLRRARVPEEQRPDALVILDEFPNYVHQAGLLAEGLVEARGYHIGWVMAHQYMAQLPHDLLTAVRASAHTKIAFPAEDSDDAKATAPLFPGLTWENLMALDKHQVAVRLCVDGHTGPTFTGYTVDVPESLGEEHAAGLITTSLTNFGRPRAEVEAEILARLGLSSEGPLELEDLA